MKRIVLFVVVAMVASLGLAACGSDSENGTANGSTDTAGRSAESFTYIMSQDIRTWDPKPETRAFTYGYYALVYDGLLSTNAAGEMIPALATDWEIEPDSITLNLREGVTFHDGTDFDAEAVKYNLEQASEAGGIATATLNAIESIEIIDPHTVKLEMNRPEPSLLYQLSGLPGLMVSPNVEQADVEQGVPAGTGPYIVDADASTPDVEWRFTKNEDYWNTDVTVFNEVTYKIMGDVSTRLNALLTGEADAVFVTGAVMAEAEANGMEVTTFDTNIAMFAIMDQEGTMVPELADKRVRQAIAHALNKDELGKAAFGELYRPLDQFFAEGSLGHSPNITGYEYDPEKAKELLAEAGVKNLTISLPSDSASFAAGATAVQGMLDRVGIKVEIDTLAPGDMTMKLAAGDYPVSYTYMPDRHPQAMYTKHLMPGSVYNPFSNTYDGIEAALDQALSAYPDEAGMGEAYAKMMEVNEEEVIFVPMAQVLAAIAYNPDTLSSVQGWSTAPFMPHVTSIEP